MGKRKVDVTKSIQNKTNRRTTLWKRKRGILKKAIELATMCEQEVFLAIYDNE